MFQFLIDEDQDTIDPNAGASSVLQDHQGEDLFAVDDRIKSENHFGVVKYIGPVTPHAGIWLGIEWDDVTRGRHSGSVDGVEYFQSSKQNGASFIRPHKATKLKDIFSALEERYGHDERIMSKLKLVDEKITPRHVHFDELKILDLANQNIVNLGCPGELVKLCPKIQLLNLAENLIGNWEVLTKVCNAFEYLKVLDVSGNPLLPYNANASHETHTILASFPKLEHIVLGKMNYNWSDILSTSVLWPNVVNLQAPFNVISKLTPPMISLLHLTSLDLESSQISDWDQVIKLDVCKCLEYLNLCGNRINIIRFPLNPSDPRTTRHFLNLKRLNVSTNAIEEWISITELHKLQTLTELRIEFNPVFRVDTKETNRQMVIARIAKLTKLEGIEITSQERRDAEIDYMKKFSANWRSEGTEMRFAAEHPRYVELIKRFGEFEEGEVSKGPQTLQSSLITLEFIPKEQNGAKPLSKQLMPSMTIHKMKMLIQRLFKISTPITSLTLISSQNPEITFLLENEHFELSSYSIVDGDKVVVCWGN